MASGWDLSSGIYDDRNVTEDELFSAILTVFSQKVKDKHLQVCSHQSHT